MVISRRCLLEEVVLDQCTVTHECHATDTGHGTQTCHSIQTRGRPVAVLSIDVERHT